MKTKNTNNPTSDSGVSPELTERRYVYNGERTAAKNHLPAKGNKPVRSRKRSSFNLILLVFGISVLIVFYIWNKICVNKLVVEVNELQNKQSKIKSSNDILRADISKKTGLERIEKIVKTEKFGLVDPKEPPVWFTIDQNRLHTVRR